MGTLIFIPAFVYKGQREPQQQHHKTIMNEVLDFFFLFLTQFAGGPGAPENNLVRFGLAAIFYGVLWYVAWSRQRKADLPREKLLVFGFGLGFLREIFMFSRASLRILHPAGFEAACLVMEPIEHALILASMVVIAGSFLRYILDDAGLTRRFLHVGLGLTAVGYIISLIWWPQQLNSQLGLRFSESAPAWIMHILAVTILGAAIAILIRKKQSWLRNIVMLALFFFFLSEFLAILNLSLATIENVALCTLANAIYICTIPLFGFIYFREQGIEKRKAEESLAAYREHLEELVKARTNELVKANKKAIILEERQRIAAEMHDGLAQTLSYLGMKIDSASEELQNGRTTPVIHQFDQMQHAIGQAIHDVRRSITSLQETPQSPQSLQEIIEQLTNERTETTQPPIQLIDLLPKPYFLSPSEREQIRPLIGEALTNACRHSQASQITVQVSSENDNLQIIVTDNGQGFSPENQAATTSNHFGLSIMQARAARIDGNLTINSQPGRGTEITLNWHPNKKMRPVKLQEVAK